MCYPAFPFESLQAAAYRVDVIEVNEHLGPCTICDVLKCLLVFGFGMLRAVSPPGGPRSSAIVGLVHEIILVAQAIFVNVQVPEGLSRFY